MTNKPKAMGLTIDHILSILCGDYNALMKSWSWDRDYKKYRQTQMWYNLILSSKSVYVTDN